MNKYFRPIFYFIPPLVSVTISIVFGYMWYAETLEVYRFAFLSALFTGGIQIYTAISDYKKWMFYYALRNVTIDYANAIERVGSNLNHKTPVATTDT